MNKLEHEREACIGCGACVAIHPDGWEMDNEGKSTIKGGIKRADGWEEKDLTTKEDEELHLEAARCCPVNVIHITKDKERII